MQSDVSIGAALTTGGLSFHHSVGRICRVGFLVQCCIIAALAACAMLAGSVIDGSLILEGRNVGLLEHPGIWAFFGLQIALPLSIRNSLNKVVESQGKIREFTNSRETSPDFVVAPVLEFLRLQTIESRSAAAMAYSVGLIAFVWNTYQNQLPGIVVPYDFWDSKNYFFGFWLTRVYKLYLFGWLLPYLAIVQMAILFVVLRLIRSARLSGKLKLIPFHPDGVGGLGFIPSVVTTPIIVALLMSAIPTAAAFQVHRAADPTPVMGLAIILAFAGIAYIVPILYLRSDILAVKHEMLGRLRELQQEYYCRMTEPDELDFETLKQSNQALEYYDNLCARVQAISNYPHLKRLLRYVGLALTPSIILFTLKLYEGVLPIIGPVLRKP